MAQAARLAQEAVLLTYAPFTQLLTFETPPLDIVRPRKHGLAMVTDLVNSLANALPDAAILAVSATLFGLFGGGIALTTNRLWFRH